MAESRAPGNSSVDPDIHAATSQRDIPDADHHATRKSAARTPAESSVDADMGLGVEPVTNYDAVQGRIPSEAEDVPEPDAPRGPEDTR